jgi:cysteine protease ATG4
MLRVGQMMMARVLKLHENVEDSAYLSFIGEGNFNLQDKNLIKIIIQFLDGETDGKLAPYSIHQISRFATENYGLEPGEWYKSNTISYCLDSCHEYFGKIINPGLKVCVFPESIIFLDQIKEKAYDKKFSLRKSSLKASPSLNKLIKEEDQDEECKNEDINLKDKKSMNESFFDDEWDNSVFVVISIRLGMKNLEPRFFNMIKELLDIRFSVGIMGGINGKAFYIVGYQDNSFIVFDPHYVQVSIKLYNINNWENIIKLILGLLI